jgi:DNA-binding MarR family transcriptional regulator
VTKQSAAQMLDLLEERGYVARESHPGDARAKVARLTARGRACIDAGVLIWAEIEREARAASGDQAVTTARAVLGRLAADAGALTGPLRLRPPR